MTQIEQLCQACPERGYFTCIDTQNSGRCERVLRQFFYILFSETEINAERWGAEEKQKIHMKENYRSKREMKLFVWRIKVKFDCDHLAVAFAESEKEAWEELYKTDKTVWAELQGYDLDWENPALRPFKERGNLEERGHKYLRKQNKMCFDTAIRPEVSSEQTAFTVWGGV